MSVVSLAASGAVALCLAAHGIRKRSLNRSGAAAAALVGFVHMASGFEFGCTLIIFYLTSSKLTKWRSDLKARVEADHAVGGQRGAGQVLANSALGGLLACAAAWMRAGGGAAVPGAASVAALFAGLGAGGLGSISCGTVAAAFVGFFACCCADTWSSEVGIVAKAPPRLATTWRRVPPGTNGGVSLLGTAAAAAGGCLVGCTFWAAATLSTLLRGADWPAGTGGSADGEACWRQAATDWRLVPLALVAGLAGSLLDSLLGATLQWSGLDVRSGKVVSGAPAAARAGRRAGSRASGRDDGYEIGPVKHICGRDVLSNTGVNVCASVLTSALAALAGAHLLPPC